MTRPTTRFPEASKPAWFPAWGGTLRTRGKDYLEHDHEFAPDVDKLTLDGEAPITADADGRYPVPLPGINKKREYV